MTKPKKENAPEEFAVPKPCKMFVLDTNVLLADPETLFGFDEHHITIPITVIEELDTFKNSRGELGAMRERSAARLTI